MVENYTDLIRRGLSLLDLKRTRQQLAFQSLRNEFYCTIWRQAAANTGIKHVDLGSGHNMFSKGGLSTAVRHGNVRLDNAQTLKHMGNKPMVYGLMAKMGYRTPRFCTYRLENLAKAESFLKSASGPVVVKPARGTGGGRGVTTGIKDVSTLRRASKFASRFGGDLLIEHQLFGHSYRLLYLNGELIDAVRRDPPTVTGDGQSTICQLINLENKHRRQGRPVTSLNPLFIDEDCHLYIAGIGKTINHCPSFGDVVQVKNVVNENAAAQQHSVFKQVHNSTIRSASKLVRNIGVIFAGIDVHCTDISKPLDKDNGLITEINTTPGIHHHYLISNPSQQVPVAEIVLSYMFNSWSGVTRRVDDDYLQINHALVTPCLL